MRDLYRNGIPDSDADNVRYVEDCECQQAKVWVERLAALCRLRAFAASHAR